MGHVVPALRTSRARRRRPTADGGAAVVHLGAVTRRFGTTVALDALDLTVPTGSITVLLGPNGAGKTTATRVITGALGADAGTVEVFGLDPVTHGQAVRRRCGVVSAKPALYDRLSGRDNLRYAAELYGLGRGRAASERIAWAADRFGIAGALDDQVGGYSTGMKTRLALARSVLHEPELLLYDEPTSGLDPESSYAVLELIREMTDHGTTVIMCTHLLLEAEGLADRVVVLQAGRALIDGPPDELIARYWPDTVVEVELDTPADLEWLCDLDGIQGVDSTGPGTGAARIRLDNEGHIPDLVFALADSGLRVRRVDPHRPSLEDLYFAVRSSSGANRVGEVDR